MRSGVKRLHRIEGESSTGSDFGFLCTQKITPHRLRPVLLKPKLLLQLYSVVPIFPGGRAERTNSRRADTFGP
jgi:hypothetical protein